MTCPSCKSEIPSGSKFCPECGGKVSSLSTQSEANEAATLLQASLPTIGAQQTVVDGNARTSAGETGNQHQELSARYELLEELGRGGFAVVNMARDRKLDRIVAVKRLLAQHAAGGADGAAVQRFMREAQLIAGLNHRNIVQVYDHDEDSRGFYIVMEYVGGGTLRQLLKQHGKLELKPTLDLMRGICQGLSHAHRKNLVHRDIKPANILLQPEDGDTFIPKIVDFGLARGDVDSNVSMSGYGMGTPAYMAPEQRRNAKGVNHTADIFALGKTLYEMLTGETPENVDPEQVPPAIGRLILKSIKTKPDERYFSVEEFWKDLELAGSNVTQKTTSHLPSINECPNCHVVNEPDAKFCEGCGTGLTRRCPECEQENSVNRPFCRACGTDVSGFVALQEAVGRMEKYAAERKWSRVIKEADAFEVSARLPGVKGKSLRQKWEAMKSESQAKSARHAELISAVNANVASGKLVEAIRMLKELEELDSDPKAVAVQIHEVREKLETQKYDGVVNQSEAAEARREWTKAKEVLDSYSQAQADAAWKQKAQHRLKELEQRESATLEELIRMAEELEKAGDVAAAEQKWRELLAMHNGNKRGDSALVRIEEHNQDLGKAEQALMECALRSAVDALETALKLIPASREALRLLAEVNSKSAHREALIQEADELEKAGNIPAAKQKWRESVALDRQHDRARDAVTRIEKHDKALAEAQQALARRDLTGAIKQSDLALQLCPKSITAAELFKDANGKKVRWDELVAQARSAEKQEQWEAALEHWDRAMELDSTVNSDWERAKNIIRQRKERAETIASRMKVIAGLVAIVLLVALGEAISGGKKSSTLMTEAEAKLKAGRIDEAAAVFANISPRFWQRDRYAKLSRPINEYLAKKRADEAARQEAARQEAQRQEAQRQEAARQEAQRQEAARQEAQRQEAARQEAQRQEAARQARAKAEAERQRFLDASKDGPWINSLGMKFVPVPGTDVLFCMWETRVMDYRTYANAMVGVDSTWKTPDFNQTADHPVVNVNWQDANSFCNWLSEREGHKYRLPTDSEWSLAVNLIESADSVSSSKTRSRSNQYPWQRPYPPQRGDGNYHWSLGIDDHPRTSPVGSFRPNLYGIYDLGGNVAEWCVVDGPRGKHVLRGASWGGGDPESLSSSCRVADPNGRFTAYGFRIVVVAGSAER